VERATPEEVHWLAAYVGLLTETALRDIRVAFDFNFGRKS
jgi:hypothetical protein